jgi:hypothetical protein
MKHRLPQLKLATHFPRPLRFGSRWRGHELPLRIVQLLALVWLGVIGGQLIARAVTGGGGALLGLLS